MILKVRQRSLKEPVVKTLVKIPKKLPENVPLKTP